MSIFSFLNRKAKPQKIDHNLACEFIKQSVPCDRNFAWNWIQGAIENEDLPAEREIKDGVLIYHFKIADIADK